MGLPLRSPVAKLSCEAATEENATCQELSQLRESFGATEFASKEWSDSHGNANQAQSKSESVKNGADDDEVFSNKGVEIDLNSGWRNRSEEHTSELQSRLHLVCRLLLEKKHHHQARGPERPLGPRPQPLIR